ncbi:MAG: PhnD/SsuA/transferrin family substrate-binding protein [bacterium]
MNCMRWKSRIAGFLFAAMAVALSTGVSCGAAEVLRVVPVGVFESEEGSDDTLDVLMRVLKSGAEFAGFKLEEVRPDGEGREEVLENAKGMVESGEIDAAVADVVVMMNLGEHDIPLIPLITMEVGGSTSYNDCFFVRKADKDKPLEDFRGSVISGWGFDSMRKILFDAGMDEPVDSFFGEVRRLDGMHPKWIIALDKGEIDGFMAGIVGMGVAIATNPVVAKKITSLACADGLKPFPAIAVRENLPVDAKKKLIDAFMSKAGRKDLNKKFLFLTKNLRWKFKPASGDWDKMFRNYRELREFAAEKGWDKEPYWGK